jgi:ABC-type transport system involved in multi-copper enzyme maturation permease subunit
MGNLFKAFLFKLRKDLTFRITLFIGLGLAVLMTLIYFGIDMAVKGLEENPSAYKFVFCTGQNLFINSLSPAQNFGIAIPINLITFTVLEFTQGTIRNKIIAGNSKTKIYFSLILSGLIFTFVLIITYSLLCLGLGSIFGGFDINGVTMSGKLNPEFFWKLILLSVLAYILITVATIFFATLLRNVGPCIPIVILLLLGCYLISTIFNSIGLLGEEIEGIKVAAKVMEVINPLYSLSTSSSDPQTGLLTITNEGFWWEIGNNIVYTGLFLGFGLLIFKKRDVK